MFEEIVNRPSRWRTFWPDVGDLSGARDAIRLAVWFCYLGSILGAIATVITLMAGGDAVAQFANTVIFGLVGLGIQKAWRSVALFAAVMVGSSMLAVVAQGQFPGVVSPFIFIGLINGMRGTFALARLSRTVPPVMMTS